MRKFLGAILAIAVTMSPVYAFNLSFLAYSPVYYFTKSDWAIAESTAMRTLNTARDNVQVNWNNPKTNAQGSFVPFNTRIVNGVKCRDMKIASEAHDVKGRSVYKFCKINGDWKVS
jgi:surface antigen